MWGVVGEGGAPFVIKYFTISTWPCLLLGKEKISERKE